MLISQLFYEKIKECERFKSSPVFLEQITYIYYKVIAEDADSIIEIHIEEQECYVSLLFKNKQSGACHYALSDYSYIEGAKDIFDEFADKNCRDVFYGEYRRLIRNMRRAQNHNEAGILLFELIYSLIERYCDELR